MSFAFYNRVFFSMVGVMIASILTVAVYMEPYSGELTRMGGYLENDYGWNRPQEEFVTPLFRKASSLDDYDRYYDVVVIGDSFSDDQVRGWQNYLAAKTGLSIITFDMNQLSYEVIIGSDKYRKAPPKILIYETIERNSIERLSSCNDKNNLNSMDAPFYVDTNPLASTETVYQERRASNSSSSIGLSFESAVNYLFKSLARTVLRLNITEVHQFRLNQRRMFSNVEDDFLLVITRDFKLKGVTHHEIQRAQCRLIEMQEETQKNGRTKFLALIFPDKTSVYAEYISDKDMTDLSIVSVFENTPNLNIAKVFDKLRNEIKVGVVDLYLPNDTHCGFHGYRMASDAVIDAMSQRGWLRTK